MPLLKTIKNSTFYDCGSLETVITPMLSDWERFAFHGCDNLKTLIVNDKTDKFDFKNNNVTYDCIIYNQDKSKKFNKSTEQWENV